MGSFCFVLVPCECPILEAHPIGAVLCEIPVSTEDGECSVGVFAVGCYVFDELFSVGFVGTWLFACG